jgi:hypothetical protein
MKVARKKRFDCVAFKREAQERICAEWETRGNEFASYAEFLLAGQSDWERSFWAQLARRSATKAGR